MITSILKGSFLWTGSMITLTIYILFILAVCVKIIMDTTSVSKTLGYLVLIVFLPLFGVILYLSLGVNYRNKAMYDKKLEYNGDLKEEIYQYTKHIEEGAEATGNPVIDQFKRLAHSVSTEDVHWMSLNNDVMLLKNGEGKFPEVIKAIENAKETIHIEYYIVRNDVIGNKIKDLLIQKAKEGVKVRFIYDDFGSKHIRKKYAEEMRQAGIEVFPFRKLLFIFWANRVNYRNHRKIIVIDGRIGFVGGINIGDDYINDPASGKPILRDMHVRLEGYSCYALQHLFLSDWNFCAKQKVEPNAELFPLALKDSKGTTAVQIVASGPDSEEPFIMNSILQAIALAEKEVLITTPYFIPTEQILTMLKIAARSQVKVKLLVPEKTNSMLVRMASRALYLDLLKAGVEIYHYQKGFIHAKTSVYDRSLAMIGTANMDIRSFDLNFEVNAIMYDQAFAEKMTAQFYEDLENAVQVTLEEWEKRPKYRVFADKFVYLASSLL
ncbi:cardiolipin synthase [Ignatzschineria ureiclastica]|uniref:Cardiolipin synthase n=1 Tax=Ignatzschineria ureiclastica TaxID=472582 RepID=A0A2U2AH12_9GAMM|nr:cardiolipin synthase [Ignatzschineria ureiclastica]PWD81930.1 cardiolipin synthase [Ignatzschineria ureiclastica]GGZ91487.1 cardiolipin synthase [Ignatzschineria ureiclastica]